MQLLTGNRPGQVGDFRMIISPHPCGCGLLQVHAQWGTFCALQYHTVRASYL